ncbi:phosphopantetheine-binding protein [Streptomyces sp. NPDC093982]|uniref:acyl carrier protein n=1 Tax=Streptomyces sp. NPDC093982 TaxID=3155077 RepID=UPI0034471BF4
MGVARTLRVGSSSRPTTRAPDLGLPTLCPRLVGRRPSHSVLDNFFELGGDSLRAVRLMAAVRRKLNVLLPGATFFSAPTIRSLADDTGVARRRVTGADVSGRYRCSPVREPLSHRSASGHGGLTHSQAPNYVAPPHVRLTCAFLPCADTCPSPPHTRKWRTWPPQQPLPHHPGTSSA